jgi:hypothetical protein
VVSPLQTLEESDPVVAELFKHSAFTEAFIAADLLATPGGLPADLSFVRWVYQQGSAQRGSLDGRFLARDDRSNALCAPFYEASFLLTTRLCAALEAVAGQESAPLAAALASEDASRRAAQAVTNGLAAAVPLLPAAVSERSQALLRVLVAADASCFCDESLAPASLAVRVRNTVNDALFATRVAEDVLGICSAARTSQDAVAAAARFCVTAAAALLRHVALAARGVLLDELACFHARLAAHAAAIGQQNPQAAVVLQAATDRLPSFLGMLPSHPTPIPEAFDEADLETCAASVASLTRSASALTFLADSPELLLWVAESLNSLYDALAQTHLAIAAPSVNLCRSLLSAASEALAQTHARPQVEPLVALVAFPDKGQAWAPADDAMTLARAFIAASSSVLPVADLCSLYVSFPGPEPALVALHSLRDVLRLAFAAVPAEAASPFALSIWRRAAQPFKVTDCDEVDCGRITRCTRVWLSEIVPSALFAHSEPVTPTAGAIPTADAGSAIAEADLTPLAERDLTCRPGIAVGFDGVVLFARLVAPTGEAENLAADRDAVDISAVPALLPLLQPVAVFTAASSSSLDLAALVGITGAFAAIPTVAGEPLFQGSVATLTLAARGQPETQLAVRFPSGAVMEAYLAQPDHQMYA